MMWRLGAVLSRYGILLKRGKYLSPAARELIKFLCPDFDFSALDEGGQRVTLSERKVIIDFIPA